MYETLSLKQKLLLKLQGHVALGMVKKEGWKEETMEYLFKCPTHGYVKSVSKGYKESLKCSICLKEVTGNNALSVILGIIIGLIKVVKK